MSRLLQPLHVLRQVTRSSPGVLALASRNAGHWYKDFLPGKYPQNEKERAESAKRYNLFPDEYRPHGDEGLHYGDYPNLPKGPGGYGVEAKDPFYPYDFPDAKRNFQEPIDVDYDLYNETRYSQPEPPRFKTWQYFASCFGVLGACFVIYFWLEDKKMFRPVLPKQYPQDGVSYTFEVNEEDPKKKKKK